jgi:hypothetical protein
LRNPAETVVSMYHHLLGEGQGHGSIGEQRKQQAIVNAQRHGLAPGISISEFVMHSIDWHIEWVVKWLRHAQRSPGLFVISYHRELANLQTMFKRVFCELDVKFNGSVSAEILEHDRFRQKASEDWRHELTSDAQKYIERRVRADLVDFPEFAQLWR